MTTVSRSRWSEKGYPDMPLASGPGGDRSIITWAPGIVSPAPPVYSDWNQIETIVRDAQGNIELLIDQTGLPGFAQVPATANLNGFGRLVIRGVGPQGEAEMQVADGGQIKDVQQWRTIVVRASPKISPTIVYTVDGIVVEMFDATFLFTDATATLPIIQIACASYFATLMVGSSEFRNSHNPGKAVANLVSPITWLLGIGELFFPSSFDTTLSGPVGSSLTLMLDASLPPSFSLPAFLGSVTTTQIDSAPGVAYTPSVPADWVAPLPTNVQLALDRMANLLKTLNGGLPIP